MEVRAKGVLGITEGECEHVLNIFDATGAILLSGRILWCMDCGAIKIGRGDWIALGSETVKKLKGGRE